MTAIFLILIMFVFIVIFGELDEMHKKIDEVDKNVRRVLVKLDVIDDTIVEMYNTYSFDCGTLNKIKKDVEELKKPHVNYTRRHKR